MTTMKKTNAAILATAMLLAAGGAAMAQDQATGNSSQTGTPETADPDKTCMPDTEANETNDPGMSTVTSAKVNLGDAVAAAEKAVGGKAVDVSAADEAGMTGWEVELVRSDGTMKTVLVDMADGTVDQNPQLENGKSEGDDRDHADNRDNRDDEDRAERGEYRDECDDRDRAESGDYQDERDGGGEYADDDERHADGGDREHRESREEGDDRDVRN